MSTLGRTVSSRDLRAELADVVGRVAYAGERIAVTRHGKIAAVLVSKEDFEMLERLEMEQDVAAYREARDADDGKRIALDDLDA